MDDLAMFRLGCSRSRDYGMRKPANHEHNVTLRRQALSYSVLHFLPGCCQDLSEVHSGLTLLKIDVHVDAKRSQSLACAHVAGRVNSGVRPADNFAECAHPNVRELPIGVVTSVPQTTSQVAGPPYDVMNDFKW